jgi:colicin import membrane protein
MTGTWQRQVVVHVAILGVIAAAVWVLREQALEDEPRYRRIAQRVHLVDGPRRVAEPARSPSPEDAGLQDGPSVGELREETERTERAALRARRQREYETAGRRQIADETRSRMQSQLDHEFVAGSPGGGLWYRGADAAEARWVENIRDRVRRNILVSGISGNPEAVFDVEILPTGEVVSVKLRKASGVRAWDAAAERAILKSSPLPLPDRREVFQKALRLMFRPREEGPD